MLYVVGEAFRLPRGHNVTFAPREILHGGVFSRIFNQISFKKGDFAVCGRRLRFHLRLPYTAGVFRSLRRAAEGFALRTHKLFEKSLIKNFKKGGTPIKNTDTPPIIL